MLKNKWVSSFMFFILISVASTLAEKLGLDPWLNGYLSGAAIMFLSQEIHKEAKEYDNE